MSIDDRGTFRLAAGGEPVDDAAWSGVAAFLDELRSAYPPGPTAEFEADHLAIIAREARLVAAERHTPVVRPSDRRRTRLRGVLVSSVTGVAVLLSAGVGVAAAMGIDPIAELVAPRLDQRVPIGHTPDKSSAGNPSTTDDRSATNDRSASPAAPSTHSPSTAPAPTSTSTGEAGERPSPAKPTKTAQAKQEAKDKKAEKDKKAKKDKKDKSDDTKNSGKGSGKDKPGRGGASTGPLNGRAAIVGSAGSDLHREIRDNSPLRNPSRIS